MKKNRLQVPQEEGTDQLSYPFDLWFHVGRFIAPDQVKTFALICCACWKVTHTSFFWLSLYKRFVRENCVLPFRLQSDNIDSGPGLQSKVVRSLYFVYPPLRELYRSNCTEVTNRKCMLFWWKKEFSSKKGTYIWNYFFKLAEGNSKRSLKEKQLWCNPEKQNIVVKIRSPNFIHFQKSAIGLILTSFNSCMSTDMRYHQIKTVFHYEGEARRYNKNDGMHMCFNPVIDVNILPWWNPSYPYHEE